MNRLIPVRVAVDNDRVLSPHLRDDALQVFLPRPDARRRLLNLQSHLP